jgi:uncharacterized membrane protein YgcG
MSPIRKLLLVGVGVLALHSLQACANETELNPQPLPPQGSTDPAPPPDQKNDGTSGGGTSSGSSGSSGATPASDADGGDGGPDGGGDAADAGVH